MQLPVSCKSYLDRSTGVVTHVARRKKIEEMAPVADAAVVPSPAQAAADAEGLRKAVQGERVTRIRPDLSSFLFSL